MITWVWDKFVEPEPVHDVLHDLSQVSEEKDWVVCVGHDGRGSEQKTGFDLVVVLWLLRQQNL